VVRVPFPKKGGDGDSAMKNQDEWGGTLQNSKTEEGYTLSD
jgi:hypothetical protein